MCFIIDQGEAIAEEMERNNNLVIDQKLRQYFDGRDGIQIMKDYMVSGSFSRGKEEKAASASMVFVGNINQDVQALLKTSSLFDPFPDAMSNDTAFLDRMHAYIPGWDIPKYRPDFFTIAVRKMVSAFVKLLYPNGEYTKEDIAEIIEVSYHWKCVAV